MNKIFCHCDVNIYARHYKGSLLKTNAFIINCIIIKIKVYIIFIKICINQSIVELVNRYSG
jgi:hypothetical protein